MRRWYSLALLAAIAALAAASVNAAHSYQYIPQIRTLRQAALGLLIPRCPTVGTINLGLSGVSCDITAFKPL
jgi:hypothetical protein